MGAVDLSIPLRRAAVWSPDPLEGPPLAPFLEAVSGPPEIAFIEPLLRRRLSALGRGMLHCAGRVAGDQPPLRAVFASRHGEPARTMPMLEDMAQGLDISPTQFSMNVHNAVAGLWSISRQDRSACTALGAGAETFGWGLVEAFSLHRTHGAPVLFVYGDDRLPAELADPSEPEAPLHAAAFLLGTPAVRMLRLRIEAAEGPKAEALETAAPQSLQALRSLTEGNPDPWTGPAGAWIWQWA